MTLDDNEKILIIKKTDEFKSNLKTILSQTVIDSKDAEEILIKNNNNLVNTLIEILEPYKQTTNSEKVLNDPHKLKIKELREIMRDKDNFFNKNKN